MRIRTVVLLAGALIGSAVGARAHHAVATVYDEDRAVTLEGQVGRFFEYLPHPLVHLDVVGDRGVTRTWAVEFDKAHPGSAATPVALRPGDRVTVCGNPGRDPGQYRLRMLALHRPADGLHVRSALSWARGRCRP